MKKVPVRKIAAYDPLKYGLSKYESYELVTRQIYDPGILPTAYEAEKLRLGVNSCILASDLNRARETSQLYSHRGGVRCMFTPCLREVRFSLKELLTEDEYQKHGSNLVRERFVDHFVNDSLLEKREMLFERIKRLENLISSQAEQKILIISHSFFMKLMEAYLKDGQDVFENPELLRSYIFPERKTYEFMEGFDLTTS